MHICPVVAKTGDVNACRYDGNCRFSHDLEAFKALVWQLISLSVSISLNLGLVVTLCNECDVALCRSQQI